MENNNEKQTIDEINKTLEPLDKANPLPDALSASAISKMLKEKQVAGEVASLKTAGKKLKRKILARRIVATAAALAVFVGTGAVLEKLYDNGRSYIDGNWNTTPNDSHGFVENELPDNIKTPSSYRELEKWFLSLRDDGKKTGSSWLGSKGNDEAIEDTVESDDGEGGYLHGKTNTQVEGVDEADIIKNDGTHLYIKYTEYEEVAVQSSKQDSVKMTDGVAPDYSDDMAANYPEYSPDYNNYRKTVPVTGIKIVKAYPATSMKEVARISIKSTETSKTLKGYDQLSLDIREFYLKDNKLYVIVGEHYYKHEGNSSESKTITSVLVYDISKKSSPELEKSFSQDGDYLSSRLTGNRLVVMTNHFVDLYSSREALANSSVPGIYQDGQESKIAVDSILMIEDVKSSSYLVISNINVSNLNEAPVYKSILGGGTDSYCTSDTLYVSNVVYDYNWATGDDFVLERAEIMIMPSKSHTEIFSFDIRKGIAFINSGKVPGHPLNQFAMDEYKGHFRIATTSVNEDGKSVNNVYVLNKDFNIVGSVTDLAKGESIQSVRFMGYTAYVVTFFRTDPLFVIDMSKPENPKVLGELEIPGFSQYMHPVGDGLILGVGVSGDENGQTDGVKVSLFDVSDPTQPKEIDKLEVSQSYIRDTSHKAFFSVPHENLYGVLIESYGFRTNTGMYYSQRGLYTFKVEGKSLKEHFFFSPQVSQDEYYHANFVRGSYINDVVYYLSSFNVIAFNMNTGEEIARL